MRQNAVSSAPQKEEPNQIEATTAAIPTVGEVSCSRRMPSDSVESAAVGKIRCRSASSDACSSCERSTRPAMNSTTSANGKIESSRL